MLHNGTCIENELYKIHIEKDITFTLDSADNKPYDLIFNPFKLKKTDYYSVLSIQINTGDKQKTIALIGTLYCEACDVAVLEGNDLVVLMNTTLVIIDCNYLVLNTTKRISEYGIYFSIHKFEDGYIIYGELDIVKLSPTFTVDWSFSGEDIFVTQDGSMPFFIENDLIHLTDWNGRKYSVNRFGKETI